MCLVSVLIITYNQQRYIGKAIESVLAQRTSFDFEVLIGDDCSDDSTADTAERYAELYDNVRLIKRDENLGASRNLYDIILRAKGEYIALLEGDDYWCSAKKLQRQIDFLESNPEFVGCSCGLMTVDEDGELCGKQYINWLKYKNRFSFSDFKGLYLPGQTGTMVYRKAELSGELLKCVYQVDRNISDRTLAMLYLLKGDIHCMDERLVCYRVAVDSKNLTKRFSSDGILINYRLTQKLSAIAEGYKKKRIRFTHFRLVLMGKALLKGIFDSSGKKAVRYMISDIGYARFIAACPISVLLAVFSKLNELLRSLIFMLT